MLVMVGYAEPWAVLGRASLRRVTEERVSATLSKPATEPPAPFALW